MQRSGGTTEVDCRRCSSVGSIGGREGHSVNFGRFEGRIGGGVGATTWRGVAPHRLLVKKA